MLTFCHYAGACTRFHLGACSDCPQLQNNGPRDWSWRNWNEKRRALADLPTAFVAGTKWIAERLSESVLFGKHRMAHIPLAMNARIRPRNKAVGWPLIGSAVKLEIVLEQGLHPIDGNRSELEQVIVNLALNARDAMPAGGRLGIETATFALASSPFDSDDALAPGRYVALFVHDTGIGMDEQTRARIFEPFFTTKGDESGTGLGLSSVHASVNRAGGRILVDSEPGRGTTFTICFPESGEPSLT